MTATPLARSTRLRSAEHPAEHARQGASTVAFYPDGTKLIVTERPTNLIDVFSAGADGTLSDPMFSKSVGGEPFGATFSPRTLPQSKCPVGAD